MIISASRRTDIPSYYSDWFFNRIKEGFVLARNPMNYHQISKIKLSPDVVDGIVFWTKNPLPMLDRLAELKDYMYYFQFTLTPYGHDIEPNLPVKGIKMTKDTDGVNGDLLTVFQRLSDIIGPDRVIWRYDPVLLSAKYSLAYHRDTFGQMASCLRNYTRKVIISFIDVDYRGVQRNLQELALSDLSVETRLEVGSALADIARGYGLAIDSCAEKTRLDQYGIGSARCIDDRLLERLLGCPLRIAQDKYQRFACGCAASIDIGMYNTCPHACRYCYANYNQSAVAGNYAEHNPLSPLISGEIGRDDKIYERSARSGRL